LVYYKISKIRIVELKEEITSKEKRAIDKWLKKNNPTTCPPMRRSDPGTIISKKYWKKKKKDE
tara:strand:- start:687 stop:875 length:189 start_codon:yes stop_codon:yes gene_type:complete